MNELKHDYNKVIEACSKILQIKLGFNPNQVLRHFQIFSMDYFSNIPDIPVEERENWYYLRETRSHASLIFNFETEEFSLIDADYKWKDIEFIKEFQKSEDKLKEENDAYVKKMEDFREEFVFKTLQPVIQWYFSCPLALARKVLPSPIEFILMILRKYSKGLEIDDADDLESIRDLIFETYHYVERLKNFEEFHKSS